MPTSEITYSIISALSAGTITAFVAKTFFVNYIKRNDLKHDNANKEIMNVRLSIARLEVVLDLFSKQTIKDLDAAHEKIRKINGDL